MMAGSSIYKFTFPLLEQERDVGTKAERVMALRLSLAAGLITAQRRDSLASGLSGIHLDRRQLCVSQQKG
jgi:hypothetical protein